MIGPPNYRIGSSLASLLVDCSLVYGKWFVFAARMPSLNALMDGLLKEIQCAMCAETRCRSCSILYSRDISVQDMIETWVVWNVADAMRCVDLLKNIDQVSWKASTKTLSLWNANKMSCNDEWATEKREWMRGWSWMAFFPLSADSIPVRGYWNVLSIESFRC